MADKGKHCEKPMTAAERRVVDAAVALAEHFESGELKEAVAALLEERNKKGAGHVARP